MKEQPYISTQQLHQYVVTLATMLRATGLTDISTKLEFASKFVSGSPSEFFAEARLALQGVKDTHRAALSDADSFKLQSVLANLDRELNRVNSG